MHYMLLLLITFAAAIMILLWIVRKLRIPRFDDRYVFITGCDTGFGNLLTKRLESLGVNVFAGCLTMKGKEELQRSTRNHVTVLSLDVTNHESIVAARKQVECRLPYGKGLWGLVNNAGITGALAPSGWLTLEDYKKCNAVNLYGMIDVTTEFLPLVITARGRIVNITSMMGRIAAAFAPYVVSKFGAEGYCDSLRRELYKTGATVHILEPGFFKTNMVNFSNFEKEFRQRFEKLDLERKNFYGQKYVEHYTSTLSKTVEKIVSPNVSWVVEAYVHALTAKYPKARYVVGWDANIFYRFLWTVPEWLSDYILTKQVPAPAGIVKQS